MEKAKKTAVARSLYIVDKEDGCTNTRPRVLISVSLRLYVDSSAQSPPNVRVVVQLPIEISITPLQRWGGLIGTRGKCLNGGQ